MPDITAEPRAGAHHLSVVVCQGGKVSAYRLLDMRTDFSPLTKELACRAAAGRPDLAGERWVLRLHALEASGDVLMEAHLADGGPGGCLGPLASVRVPLASFSAIASRVAKDAQLDGDCKYGVLVHAPDAPIVADWDAQQEDPDFELAAAEPQLTMPDGFAPGEPPGGRQVVHRAGGWLRCVFRRRAFEQFLDAAAAESDRERSWLGAGRVHLSSRACHVVIEDALVELPGEAGQAWVVTHGRDWARLYRQVGDRLVAFLHLHPRTVEGKAMRPHPSTNDAVVAWNVCSVSPRPVVLPIAMFGTDRRSPGEDVAVFGYENGLLRQIQLEVC